MEKNILNIYTKYTFFKRTTPQIWDLKNIAFLRFSLNRDDYTEKEQTKTNFLTSDSVFMYMLYFYSLKGNKAFFLNEQTALFENSKLLVISSRPGLVDDIVT